MIQFNQSETSVINFTSKFLNLWSQPSFPFGVTGILSVTLTILTELLTPHPCILYLHSILATRSTPAEANPASYPVGTRGSSLGGKVTRA